MMGARGHSAGLLGLAGQRRQMRAGDYRGGQKSKERQVLLFLIII
jgi:hypothetical protein